MMNFSFNPVAQEAKSNFASTSEVSLFLIWGLLFISVLAISSTVSANEINNETVLQSIQKNILIHDAQNSVSESQQLGQKLELLEKETNIRNLESVQQQFIKLMSSWKKVEAVYNAGNINNDMLDVPHYIDVYHSGNEDIYKQLERGLKSDKKIESVLFKNSTKSINALEYLLFSENNSDTILGLLKENKFRRIQMASYVNQTIEQNLIDIHQTYENENNFVSQGKKSIEDIVNVLIDSTYKLLTWRVAEPAGFSDKYKGKPDVKHMEYYLSQSSLLSIESILLTYQRILNSSEFLELGDLGIKHGVSDEISSVQNNIAKAQAKNEILIKKMADENVNLEQILLTSEYEQLYKSLVRLHNSFYILLIDALGLKSKIIEADGD